MKQSFQLGVLLLAVTVAIPSSSGDGLFGQVIEKLLNEKYPREEISYLLLDTQSGAPLASRWKDSETPVPVGSLIKPFTAMAYLRNHSPAPEFTCTGEAGGCWYGPGHGRLDLAGALAHSCNAYFRNLVLQMEPTETIRVAEEFHLTGLSPKVDKETMVGFGTEWSVPPAALARSYGEFVLAADGETAPILNGLALSSRLGTGKAVGEAVKSASALVKTGTAPCVHGVEWSGDGYVMTLYPRQTPRYTLLVRVHGSPGAEAGITAGRMLATVLEAE